MCMLLPRGLLTVDPIGRKIAWLPSYFLCKSQGMGDAQLMHLLEVLKLKRIWAVNIGENFQVLVALDKVTAWLGKQMMRRGCCL